MKKLLICLCATIIILCFSSARSLAEEIDYQTVISSGDIVTLTDLIENGSIESLCDGLPCGEVAVKNPEYIARFIMSEPYTDNQRLAIVYVTAKALDSDSWAPICEIIDSGIADEVSGKEVRHHNISTKNVAMELAVQRPSTIIDFAYFYCYIATELYNQSTVHSSGGGGSEQILVLDESGNIPDSIVDNSNYTVHYSAKQPAGTTVIFALYNENHALKSIISMKAQDGEAPQAVLSLCTTDTIKVIATQSLTTLKPVDFSPELKINDYKSSFITKRGVITEVGSDYIRFSSVSELTNGEWTDYNSEMHLETSHNLYRLTGCMVELTYSAAAESVIGTPSLYNYETTILDASEITSFSLAELVTKDCTYSIAPNVNLYENGMPITQAPLSSFYGEVILGRPLGSDTYDMLNATCFESDMFLYNDASSQRIYTSRAEFSYSASTLFMLNGESISPCDIPQSSIISFAVGPGNALVVYVSTETQYGAVTFNEDSIEINGTTFYPTQLDIEAGYNAYTMYIDVFGNAVFAKPDKTLIKSCFITACSTDASEGFSVKISSLTEKDNVYKLSDMLFYNEYLINTAALFSDLSNAQFPFYAELSVKDGRVNRIDTAQAIDITANYSKNTNLFSYSGASYLVSDSALIMCTDSTLKTNIVCSGSQLKDILQNRSYNFKYTYGENPWEITSFIISCDLNQYDVFFVTECSDKLVKGYINGELKAFSTDDNCPMQPYSWYKIGCYENKINSFTFISQLYDSFECCVPTKNVNYVGGGIAVYNSQNSITVGGNNEQYFSVGINADTVVYILDSKAGSLKPGDASDIIADPNMHGYGSYVCVRTGLDNVAYDIIIIK